MDSPFGSEATFRHLAAHCVDPSLVLMTGKGYLDASTRHLLKLIESSRENPKILALVDCDPWGLDIYLNVKIGSSKVLVALGMRTRHHD